MPPQSRFIRGLFSRQSAQCHLLFPIADNLHNSWGGPPGPRPTPPSASRTLQAVGAVGEQRDEGVPRGPGGPPHHISAGFAVLGKLSGIGRKRLPHQGDRSLTVAARIVSRRTTFRLTRHC
jgi:hypothetical protein